MPDKIKLTEEHKNCECNDMLKKTNVCMPEKCHIIHEDILDLFDYYKKKSEQYDDLMQANNEMIKRNIFMTELERENKQLKDSIAEDNLEIKEFKDELKLEQLINEAINEESFNFKEKLEKLKKELQKRIDEETKHINHSKQIYRTIEHNCKYNLRVCEILKEILNVNK